MNYNINVCYAGCLTCEPCGKVMTHTWEPLFESIQGLEKHTPRPGPSLFPLTFFLPAQTASPHSGLVHKVLPLAVILHVRVVGGEHGIKRENLLLDGTTICHLPKSRGATVSACPALAGPSLPS